jgi:hypothetical protein
VQPFIPDEFGTAQPVSNPEPRGPLILTNPGASFFDPFEFL